MIRRRAAAMMAVPSMLALSLAISPPARADDLTVIKGGEWTTTVTGMGPQPIITTVCMAEQRIDHLGAADKPGAECTKREVSQIPGGVRLDMVCSGIGIQGTAISTGPDSYRTDMTMTMQGAPPMTMISEARWNGPCKPGQTPTAR